MYNWFKRKMMKNTVRHMSGNWKVCENLSICIYYTQAYNCGVHVSVFFIFKLLWIIVCVFMWTIPIDPHDAWKIVHFVELKKIGVNDVDKKGVEMLFMIIKKKKL